MIGKILYKDWRLLWPLAVLVTLIQACLAWALYRYGFFGEDRVAHQLIEPLTLAWYAGVCALAVAVVQQDSVPAVDQDWLIRPLKRTELLASKLLFVAVTVCVPMWALDVARALAMGFPLTASVGEAALKAAIVMVWLLVPVLALSALASTLMEFMILAAALVGAYALALSVSALLGVASCPTCGTGVVWLEQLMQHASVLLGACVILALQYYRRWTRLSRSLALLGVLALVFVQLPWRLAFGAQRWLSAAPGASASVAIALDPERLAARWEGDAGAGPTAGEAVRHLLGGEVVAAVEYLQRRGSRYPPVRIDLPLRISGLAADELLLVDRSRLRLLGPRGAEQYRGVNSGALEPQDAAAPAGSTRAGEQIVYVPAWVYRRDAGDTLRLELDYSLSLMKRLARHRITAESGWLSAPDMGRCETRLDEDGTSIALRCRKLGRQPYCLSATLLGPDGRRNPEVLECDSNYRPDLPGYTDVLRFYGFNIPVRDPLGLTRYPVAPAELGRADLLIEVYEPKDHFRRTLVVPRIRLAEARRRTP